MDMRAVRGLAQANARLDFLPKAASEQLGVEVGIIAREVLVAQRRDVASDTGFLRGQLTVQAQIERLRARVGLIGVRRAKTSKGRTYRAFYGRFVEHGRREQTVTVTRGLRRKVRGNGRTSKRTVTYLGAGDRVRRRGPNKGTPIGSPYKLRVRAMAARPYVHKDRPEHRFDDRIASFWAGLMARGS